MSDVQIERRLRTARHGNHQSATCGKVLRRALEKGGGVVQVLQDFRTNGVTRPSAQSAQTRGRLQQIALEESGGGKFLAGHFDSRGAELQSRDLSVREIAVQVECKVALSAANVEDAGRSEERR